MLSPQFGTTRAAGDVKMVLGLFGDLFGTPDGALLRQLCRMRGWALVWALGPADAGGAGFTPQWANGQPIYPLNQRLLDPVANGGAGHNLSLPLGPGADAVAVTWAALEPGPQRTMDYVRLQWMSLWAKLPRLRLGPLYGISCADIDCIGVLEDGDDCVCYQE